MYALRRREWALLIPPISYLMLTDAGQYNHGHVGTYLPASRNAYMYIGDFAHPVVGLSGQSGREWVEDCRGIGQQKDQKAKTEVNKKMQ